MMLHKATYFFYLVARKAVRAAGLTRVMRWLLGPIAGRMMLRLTANADCGFQVNIP